MIAAKTGLVDIGPREIRKRLLSGVVMLAAVVLAVIFSHAGVNPRVVCGAIPAVLDGDSRSFPGSQKNLSGSRRARRAQNERLRRAWAVS
jgi:hypothetical protein